MYDEAQDIDKHRRAVETLFSDLAKYNYPTSGFQRCLDVGGGKGLHAPWLQKVAKHVICSDVLKYDTVFNFSFRTETRRLFQKHSVAVDYERLEFHTVDAQDLIYKDKFFDLVVSFDAFEHIPDPSKALIEIARVTRPGSLVAFQFDPIWNSPYGHHLKHLVTEPWAHLVNSYEDFEDGLVKSVGAERGARAISIFRNEMNRRPFSFYEDLFFNVAPKYFENTHFKSWAQSVVDEPNMNHPNFDLLTQKGFERKELITRGIQFFGIRKAGLEA